MLTVTNGTLTVTNAGLTGTMDVRRGSVVFNGGTINTDALLLNTGTSSVFTFNGGTLTTGSTQVANGTAFVVGNGTAGAVFNLSGTSAHSFADGLSVSSNSRAVLTNGNVSSGAGLSVNSGGAMELQNNITVTPSLTLSGSGISNGGALRNISGTNAYNGAITLGSASQINSDAGTLTLGGAITNAGQTLTVGGAAGTTLGGGVSGTGGLVKDGAGTLLLNGSSSYSGGTTINSGTLQLGASERLADTGAVTVSGGTLDLQTFNEMIGAITLSSGSIIGSGTLTGSSYLAQSGTIGTALSGTAALTKSTSGLVALSGSNTYSGGTTINAGTLKISSDSNLGDAGGGVILDEGTLQATGTITSSRAFTLSGTGGTIDTGGNSFDLGGVLSGTGALTKTGTGTLTISGTSNAGFTGPTNIDAGRLFLNGSTVNSPHFANNLSTLGGVGAAGDVTVQSGGTMAPGFDGTGSFITKTFNLRSGGHLAVEIGGVNAGASSNGYDQLKTSGNITLAGDLDGSLLNGYTPPDQSLSYVVGGPNISLEKYFIIRNEGASPVSGFFANQITTGNMFNGAVPTIFFGTTQFVISYTGDYSTNSATGGYDVVLIPVPEPDIWASLAGGLALQIALARFRRRG